MTTMHALSPAKLNLGLEILGKRADGFHEIRTVMTTVALFDRLVISPGVTPAFHVDCSGLNTPDNLVPRAASLFEERCPNRHATIDLRKRIPEAAGLGGASGNAAATLLALNRLSHGPIPHDQLVSLGATLGSDVPFFFSGGTALVAGRGESITSMPPMCRAWAVIVVPRLVIPAKTKTLYGALLRNDYSDGSRVDAMASAIRRGEAPASDGLTNAFTRALYAIVPALTELSPRFRAAEASCCAVTGAGPAHFSLEEDPAVAHAVARRLVSDLGPRAIVHVGRTMSTGIHLSTAPRVVESWTADAVDE